MLSAKPKTEADNTYQGLKDKHTVTRLLLEIMHYVHNLQISQFSAGR